MSRTPVTFGIPADAVDAWRRLCDALAAEETAGGFIACQSDPEAWHNASEAADTTAAALRCCQVCPALTTCRAYALAADEPSGVWGGLTVTDRQRARREAVA